MSDDRSTTGSESGDGAISDDELADVLAAELERYATGAVPLLPAVQQEDRQPQSSSEPRPDEQTRRPQQGSPPQPLRAPRERTDGSFAERAAEVERVMRSGDTAPVETDPFRRTDRPAGRRSATGPVLQPGPVPTDDDLPVRRRSGFRPPPGVEAPPPAQPLDRVLLPTGPIDLPEPTASLLESMISDSAPTRPARHAAPPTDPVPQQGELPDVLRLTGELPVPGRLYEDWEQSLRSIGRPRGPWDGDDEVVPTGGDPDLPTVAVPVHPAAPIRSTGPTPAPAPAPTPPPAGPRAPEAIDPPQEPSHGGAHALPVAEPLVAPDAGARRRRSGRRRAAISEPDPEPERVDPDGRIDPDPAALPDVDAEGIDEVVVDYPVVSAATTGAIDLPAASRKPRTAPVMIERVRTAILQLPAVPTSPTGSGAAAILGRWFGAFASPLVLVLGFGLVGAGAGPAAAVAVLAGALLAVPALARSAAWSASAGDDRDGHETAVLGHALGRVVAVVLLLVRLGAAAVVLLLAGTVVGAWADRTGALGLSASTASIVGTAAVALLALVCTALPVRATAVLVALAVVVATIGTALLALVLAPTGSAPVPSTVPGVVAAAVAGFVGVGLLLVVCGADVARWRTAIARPASSAVGAVAAAVLGAVLVAAATVLASRLGGGGSAADDFAGALSDASASALAGPLLVVLVVASVPLPSLVLRSSGAAAARLIGDGRPARLGTVAAGMLALAGALGLLAAGSDPDGVALAAAGLLGIPAAAWAGVLTLPPAARVARTGIGMAVAVLVGLLLADGLVPGATSPVLDLVGVAASTGLRGGPAVGVAVALLLGVLSGAVGRIRAPDPASAVDGPADTVEG